jgi:hypothetical protein
MQLGHLLTRSGLTYPEVSSKVCHDSFCQLGNSVSLPWVIYYGAFYLHVVVQKVMPPYLYLYSYKSYLNETQDQIQLRMCIAAIHHSSSFPLVRYNFRLFSEPFSPQQPKFLHYMWNEFLLNVSWNILMIRNQTLPNPGCKEVHGTT